MHPHLFILHENGGLSYFIDISLVLGYTRGYGHWRFAGAFAVRGTTKWIENQRSWCENSR